MKIVERFNSSVEYYPSKGCKFVKRDRTAVYPWFLTLKKGESINDYAERIADKNFPNDDEKAEQFKQKIYDGIVYNEIDG